MKKFFEQYGGVALGILAVLVLIAMITPVGNIIKTSLQGTATKFSGNINGQVDTAMAGTSEAQNGALREGATVLPPEQGGTPVVPGTPEPTPSPGPETSTVPPVEPVTPENYSGYVTEPGKYFVNLTCENKSQKPGAIPMSYCLDYEINVFVGKELAGTSSEKVINYTSYKDFNSPTSETTNFTKELGSWTGWINDGIPSSTRLVATQKW